MSDDEFEEHEAKAGGGVENPECDGGNRRVEAVDPSRLDVGGKYEQKATDNLYKLVFLASTEFRFVGTIYPWVRSCPRSRSRR